jgi:para-nitrobenzyl esterase
VTCRSQFLRGRHAAGVLLTAAALTAGSGAGTAVAAGPARAAGRPAAAAGVRSAPLVVRTDKGAVRGTTVGDAREFLGIPYAAPPTGALRWRPPQPAARWQGLREATTPGDVCAQTGDISTGIANTSTSEDCLFLNVYTPRTARSRHLPVMVWLPGGGFRGGAGSIYDGAVLAAKGNVIVVTINYRVGAFGFLALPSLDAESRDNSSGDFGLQDQQAAMRWVRRNAAAFGGDRHNVTIFGESAGGTSVCANIASPTAAGLFDHAIAESGCLFPAPSKQAAEQQGAGFAASQGCTDAATAAACLRGRSAAELLATAGSVRWSPDTGSRTFPARPADAFASGRFNHVPVLQGANHDEGRFFVALQFDARGAPMTAAEYPAQVAGLVGAAAAPRVLAQYPLSSYPSPGVAFATVRTDEQFSCPALQADQLLARTGAFGYEFNDPNPPNDLGVTFSFPLGDAHSTELQYVFQREPVLDIVPPFTAPQRALSDQMISYWSRFAATGNPNGIGPRWPAFTARDQRLQSLTSTGTAPQPAAGFAADHQCAFWAALAAGTG